MVDLNFLLLMFFMFTTTFTKPNIMDLTLPAKPDDKTAPVKPPMVDLRNSITFIIGKDDNLF